MATMRRNGPIWLCARAWSTAGLWRRNNRRGTLSITKRDARGAAKGFLTHLSAMMSPRSSADRQTRRRRMRLRFREGGEARMVGREMAGGSVAAGSPVTAIAWQRQPPRSISRLVAGAARLLHPVRAAKCVEGGAIAPDIARSRSRTLSKTRPAMSARRGRAAPCPKASRR